MTILCAFLEISYKHFWSCNTTDKLLERIENLIRYFSFIFHETPGTSRDCASYITDV